MILSLSSILLMFMNSLIVIFDLNVMLDPDPPDLALNLEVELLISSVYSTFYCLAVSSLCFDL